eukprot:Colp12_sorted_trinity150504_noHs@36326
MTQLEKSEKDIKPSSSRSKRPLFKVYKRRWYMLLIFSLFSCTNEMLWITFAPVATDVQDLLGISDPQVQMLSTIFMSIYIPFSFPGSAVYNMYGLRLGVTLGAFLNMLGAALRFFGVYFIQSYALVFCGQTLAALAQTLIFCVPAKLASVYFPPPERALATGLSITANNVGIAVGMLIPTLVTNSTDFGSTFSNLLLSYFVMTGVVFLVIAFTFQSHPPTPPSTTSSCEEADLTVKETIKQCFAVMKDKNFALLAITFGINTGGLYAVSTLIEPILKFMASSSSIGWLGFGQVISGTIGSIVLSFVFNWGPLGSVIATFLLSVIGLVSFTVCVHFATYIGPSYVRAFTASLLSACPWSQWSMQPRLYILPLKV